ncbi:MAG: hypothetical protein GX053_01050 [Tissierella sp.]|nr:hypothetical protein [Tissierella sp.]
MAKYEKTFKGNFSQFKDYIQSSIMNGSASVSYEDGSDITMGDTKLSVQVYERYSMAGGNRVSLNITILGNEDDIFVSAITSGGSQAVFFKINTIGEETFLDLCVSAVEKYISNN